MVGRNGQPGWEVMLCGKERFTYLVGTKAELPRGKTLLAMLCDNLREAVTDRVPADLPGEAEEDAFRRLVYVLWVPVDLNADQQTGVPALKEVEAYMESQRDKAISEESKQAWARALRYVRLGYDDNVVLVGAAATQRLMPPVLQPIAALVRAVTTEPEAAAVA